jgi:putative PIN family toxin of toxin-antitoxin system
MHLYTSIPLLTELARKLQDKIKWKSDRVKAAVRHVAAVASVLKACERISAVTDEPDNRIPECAVAGNADMVVTGDRHLLDLKGFEGIEIVTLAVFLERV